MSLNPNSHLVIIPTYNEIDNIPEFVSEISKFDVSVLFVDDNSPDGTGELISKITKSNVKVNLLKRPLSRTLNIIEPTHVNKSIKGNKIKTVIKTLNSTPPAKYINNAATPSIINPSEFRLALRLIADIPCAIKYTAMGGPPIPVAPFVALEKAPIRNDNKFIFGFQFSF